MNHRGNHVFTSSRHHVFMSSCLYVFMSSCISAPTSQPSQYIVQHLSPGSTTSMRGISVVSERVAWASGTAGTVLRTTDGGVTWQAHKVPRADSLDFRDIEAFDSLTAYALSAGEDGRIYFTRDGGASWSLQFRNEVKGAFYDCLDFFDRTHGIAMSDPINDRYLLLSTSDGQTWRELP